MDPLGHTRNPVPWDPGAPWQVVEALLRHGGRVVDDLPPPPLAVPLPSSPAARAAPHSRGVAGLHREQRHAGGAPAPAPAAEQRGRGGGGGGAGPGPGSSQPSSSLHGWPDVVVAERGSRRTCRCGGRAGFRVLTNQTSVFCGCYFFLWSSGRR